MSSDSNDPFTHFIQGCITGSGTVPRLPCWLWISPWKSGQNWSLTNHNKTQQNTNRTHNSWNIGCICTRTATSLPNGRCPLNTWRNNNIVITSKRRHFDVKWHRFDVITTSLLRYVFVGWLLTHWIYVSSVLTPLYISKSFVGRWPVNDFTA